MTELILDHTVSPKYPEVRVQLTGEDGNAFFIIGRVTKALKSAGIDAAECSEFTNEAMSGDYNNVIQTAMRWVEVA
jgi:hypothetical protein